ncbi:hypothetical protein [Streptomyces flavofungini]|uniref:hypothetical protein n=1 Tax=Streptomyces flavofungini TaxID=68200 RepID=UPI0034DECD1C
MIRSWIGEAPTGRTGHGALLFGLVLLLAAHLAGGVHGATFTGPHTTIAAAVCSGEGHPGTGEGAHRPGAADGTQRSPGHDYRADSHFDHSVDRPRADSGDTAAALDDSGTVHGARDAAAFGRPCGGDHREGGPCAPGGRSALALHCVWRQ